MPDTRSTHPCDRREPFSPWKADHLYVSDDGEVLCGRCMGIESTYHPWSWSDLGAMDLDRTVTIGPEVFDLGPDRAVVAPPRVLMCETDRYVARRHGTNP